MKIGTNLRKLRIKTKYSQQDIANLLEIDRVTYANWENETTDVKSQFIPKLADIFGVSIGNLFENNMDSSNKIAQQGIFIKISDTETALQLAKQINKLLQNLRE